MSFQRVKWQQIKFEHSLTEVGRILNQNYYDEDIGYGFLNVDLIEGKLSALYSECCRKLEVTHDPYGNVIEREIVDYNYVAFEIVNLHAKRHLISFINPPKSIKFFVTKLAEIFDFHFSISNINIDISVFIKLLNEEFDVTLLSLNKVKVSGLVVNQNSTANVELTSKSDALSDIMTLTEGRKFVLDRVKASAVINEQSTQFEISKSGMLSVEESLMEIFYKALKKHLGI